MGAIYVSLVSLALGRRPVHGTIAFGEVSNATHFTSNWMLDKVFLTEPPSFLSLVHISAARGVWW